jgi:hypothetical protein
VRPNIFSGPDADHIKLSASCGGAEDNAILVVVNMNPAVPNDLAVSGARADACGAWDATVYAHRGDVLELTQEYGTAGSPPTILQVP